MPDKWRNDGWWEAYPQTGAGSWAKRGSGVGDWWCARGHDAAARCGTFIIGEVVQRPAARYPSRRVRHSTHSSTSAHWAGTQSRRREGRASCFGATWPAEHSNSRNKASPPEWLMSGACHHMCGALWATILGPLGRGRELRATAAADSSTRGRIDPLRR